MGAITDLDHYRTLIGGFAEPLSVVKAGTASSVGRATDLWAYNPFTGAAPSTAVVPTRATTGALGQSDAGTEQLYIAGATLAAASASGAATGASMFVLCDRLSHQGGLSGTTTGAQTTNLPTAALTRYTDGIGVMAGLTIYTAIGTTGTTVTMSYTDHGGNSGSVSPGAVIGGTNFNAAGRMILMPLADDDHGVRSVESVTLAASTVSAAGNFGVTLFKPLMAFAFPTFGDQIDFNIVDGGMIGGLPEIADDACLFWLSYMTNPVTLSGVLHTAKV